MHVISNADVAWTYLNMIPQQQPPHATATALQKQDPLQHVAVCDLLWHQKALQ
jgi:hypothetical protein